MFMNSGETSVYLTAKQAAERIGVHAQTLWDWRKTERGPKFIRRCGRIYYPLKNLDEWYSNGDETR